jgi:pimeloyl-ACP methyl ester carboxylesterase
MREIWKPEQLMRSWYIFFFQLPYLPERLLSSRGGALVSRMLRRAMVDASRVPPGKLAEYEANFSQLEAARAAIDYYRVAFRRTVRPGGLREMKGYPRIRAPFLLIWGERDQALSKKLTKNLEPWFEQRPIVHSLPEEGHFMPLEAPGKVASLLLEHLTGDRPRKAWDVERSAEMESHGEGPQPSA